MKILVSITSYDMCCHLGLIEATRAPEIEEAMLTWKERYGDPMNKMSWKELNEVDWEKSDVLKYGQDIELFFHDKYPQIGFENPDTLYINEYQGEISGNYRKVK